MWTIWVIAKTQQEADIVLEQWKHLFTEKWSYSPQIRIVTESQVPWALSWTVSPFVAVSVGQDFRTLRRALDEVLRRRKITGRALELVIGHITFVLLGARPALCTLPTRYRFMRAHYHVATRLWTETRAEVVAVR